MTRDPDRTIARAKPKDEGRGGMGHRFEIDNERMEGGGASKQEKKMPPECIGSNTGVQTG